MEEGGMFICARPGELFARVKLNNELTYDTDAGALVLDSAPTVLVTRDGSQDSKVYEAGFVDKDTYSYEGRGKDFVVLVLKESCCSGLGLAADAEVPLVFQFRMDRLPFARMHYALDELQDTKLLFPDSGKIAKGLPVKRIHDQIRPSLNDSQHKILQYIVGEVKGHCPPMIMYGPFGTGKTETLLRAAMILARDKTKRILICSQSNSAADLYVTRLREHSTCIRMCRVLALTTPLNRVDKQIRQYCFLSKDGTEVVRPTRDGILVCQVVISTLVNSLILTRLKLRGHFTHIFIDEAGQALESESVIPLLLAVRTTCCVLTGDHIQMSPKVYSPEAKKFKFHHSILERLFLYYLKQPATIPPTDFPFRSFLTVNYRSSPAIVHFISTVFYDGNDINTVKQPVVKRVPPLQFAAVEGREVQDEDGTSYYNMDEVNRVAEAVFELWEDWPEEWGERNAKEIAVVTPYREQVLKMRYALKKKCKDLRNAIVERVQNVQGKEVRVMFISTVRTRFICDDHQANPQTTSDLGFLTDKKLLNTAMTRARSVVGVFGDPVALCSIGECAHVWQVYMEHCHEQRSLYPTTKDLDDLDMAVQQFRGEPKYMSFMSHLGKGDQIEKRGDQIDEDLDFTASCDIEPDEILKQLAIQIRQERAVGSESTHPVGSVNAGSFVIKHKSDEAVLYCSERTEDVPAGTVLYSRNSSRSLHSGDGPADGATTSYADCVLYGRNSTNAKRIALAAGGKSREFRTANDTDDDDVTSSVDDQSLDELLETKPDVYKRCIAHIKSSMNMYAETIDNSDCRINIGTRLRCGQAFDQDTVVVEILKPSLHDRDEAGSIRLQGRVVGVLKREKDPRYRIFVCSVDPSWTSKMVPIAQGIPKIHNLSQETHLHQKGKVIVYTFKEGQIKFKQYEEIDELNPKSKLFAVRYLKWDLDHPSPLGIVIGVLPPGNTVARGLKILNIEYKASEKNSSEALKEVSKRFPKGYDVPYEFLNQKGRWDYSSKLVLAIDPPGTKDVDDAISFENGNKPDTFRIGVHIADVTAFIDKDSPLDMDASTRCTSLYPPGADILHMLPERLGTDVVSLRDRLKRLALSFFMTVDKEGTVTEVEPQRSVVRATRRTYEDVENYLSDDSHHLHQECPTEQRMILSLYHIVRMWHRKRMGNAALHLDSDDDAKDSPKAHCLVKELMLMVNHQVAKYLMAKFRESTPLRRHLAPNEHSLAKWKKEYALDAMNSLSLRYPFVYPGDICNCKDVCTCVQDPPGEQLDIRDKEFVIRKDVWNKIHQCNTMGYLRKIEAEQKPKVVRMYSELLEGKDFPIPMEPIPNRRRKTDHESSLTEEHKEIALHHIIRRGETDDALRLLEFDQRFKDDPRTITLEDVKEYKALVCALEVTALGNAEIILCTCTASGSPKIRKLLKPYHEDRLPENCINQVIVDECGMCQEPESMIPITAASPNQVVLIGDHKQLQPIITNDRARKLGLGTSLFERYSQEADMLTVQYRMHRAIAAFPSQMFYDDRLIVGDKKRQAERSLLKIWPGNSGGSEPIAFCHVEGKEEVLSVASAEGNEQSKKNVIEVEFAVEFAQKLVKLGVQPKNVAILSQYRAQCGELERHLMQREIRGRKQVKVGTVVSSQGSEWDYVILSTVASLPRSQIESNPNLGWVQKTLGFITDQNQINVAITRARKGLIIVGNKYLLQCDMLWKGLLQHYEDKGKIVEAGDFMR